MTDVRGTIRTIIKPTALTVMVTAAVAMTIADMYGDRNLFRFAVTAWLVAATTYIGGRTGITTKVLERERQRGYDDGYRVARQGSRPVVVPFRSAGLKPALHLGQKNVVGGLSEDGP